MTEDFEDFYDLMDLDEDASQEEIKSAFREKVREYHPDLNDDDRAQAQFTALKTAYDTLGNPSERNAYDRMGHEDYVVKRTKGLPSQDVWSSSSSSSSSPSGSSSSTSTSAGASTGATGSSGGRSAGTTSSSNSSGRRSSGSSSGTSGTSGTGSAASSGTDDAASSSSSNTGTAATGSARASTSGSTASSTTSTGRATASGSATASYGGQSTTTGTTEPTDPGLLGRLLRIKIGWPGIAVANVLYLLGAALFALANLGSLRTFGAALATTETATVRSAALAEPAETFGSYLYGTDYLAATQVSARAAVLVAGAVVLPFVYGVVVKRTRRASIRWEPTWLYVVCTLGPLTGVVLNLVGYAYVGADVALFLVAPLLSVLALPLSAFVRPFLKRVFFE